MPKPLVRRIMSKKEMTEEEALAAKYRKFDDDGKRIYDGPTLEQHQLLVLAIKSGALKVEAPNGENVKFDKGEE